MGLGISIWVLFQTWAIRRAFALRARLPESVATLREISETLVKSLGKWPAESGETLTNFARIRAILINLQPKLEGAEKTMSANLLIKVSARRPRWKFWGQDTRSLSNDEAWQIYYDLQGVIESLEQRVKDSKWE
jgi:hypothetical protein